MNTVECEAAALVGSDEMNGAPLFRPDGARLGEIEQVMTDGSGDVAYAVMGCRGGEDRYPLPWSLLTYNPDRQGYDVEITDGQLKGAPKFCRHESWDWASRERRQMLNDYYNVAPA